MALGASLDLYSAECYGSTTLSRLVDILRGVKTNMWSLAGSDLGGREGSGSWRGCPVPVQFALRSRRPWLEDLELQKFLNSKPVVRKSWTSEDFLFCFQKLACWWSVIKNNAPVLQDFGVASVNQTWCNLCWIFLFACEEMEPRTSCWSIAAWLFQTGRTRQWVNNPRAHGRQIEQSAAVVLHRIPGVRVACWTTATGQGCICNCICYRWCCPRSRCLLMFAFVDEHLQLACWARPGVELGSSQSSCAWI